MSLFRVTPQKAAQLERRMAELGVVDSDLVEKFIRGSGSGGQKINKTSSCVYLLHKTSGIEVKCQRDRSQALNRFYARRELCDKLEEKRDDLRSARQQRIEKVRRQKRRRSRKQKERMLEKKHKQSEKKQLRGKVDPSKH